MSLNPITTTDTIRNRYIKYLQSMFSLKDKELALQASSLLDKENKFTRGPYIEITPPFVAGKSINDLIDEAVLAQDFQKLNQNELPADRPLFLHQEQAVKKMVSEEKNLVVATGTGSGKTECFLIPIINYLMRQKEESGSIRPGVRALLLYPMNALANDQLARLRKLLDSYPEITFGRYTGETAEYEDKALQNFYSMYPGEKRLNNELISREEMRERPPHLLLTNYAMLEYLLLRPEDNTFFDGEFADEWRFIVLDEAHTYTGAKGTELSMLISRLKERILKKDSQTLRCVATSATLGSESQHPEVARFGTDIFGETFFDDSIIKARRILYENTEKLNRLSIENYETLLERLERGEKDSLYEDLRKDLRVFELRNKLTDAPKLLAEVANDVFSDLEITQNEKEAALVTLVRLCAEAKTSDGAPPLLPARYHVFIKALEGAYVAFYPNKKLYLDRHKTRDEEKNKHVPVFEIANCQRCGQEYIYGKTTMQNGVTKLVQGEMEIDEFGIKAEQTDYFLLAKEIRDAELNEDEIAYDQLASDIKSVNDLIEYTLCTACGTLTYRHSPTEGACCSAPSSKLKQIYGRKNTSSSLNVCYSCGAHSGRIVKRFISSDDAATEVLAESLYMSIPAKSEQTEPEQFLEAPEDFQNPFASIEAKNQNIKNDESSSGQHELGRKLLVFSDSRQDAAFFASFLDLKYNQSLWRYTILESAENLKNKYSFVNLNDLSRALYSYSEKHYIYPDNMSEAEKYRLANHYLMKEFHTLDRRIGLEGLGLISFDLPMPEHWPALPALQSTLQVDKEGLWSILVQLFNTFRQRQCTTYLPEVHPRDDFFAPRNRPAYFSITKQDKLSGMALLSWLPADSYSNSRLDYIKKILLACGRSESEAEPLARQWLSELIHLNGLVDTLVGRLNILSTESGPKTGTLYRLNHNEWSFELYPERLFQCDTCNNLTLHNIHGVCPQYRCNGLLQPYKREESRDSYYIDLYRDRKPIPMVAKEHTAQLQSRYALSLQNDFGAGKVNILSCSTTFEMGVDVGQLEAVFMRNVPPETANYVQRAGRAGRRTDATAYALTYAKKRSHDLSYYQDPKRIISGKIKTPYIVKDNDKIVLRHIYATTLSWFFRKYPNSFRLVKDFFGLTEESEDSTILLKKELTKKPQDLLESLKKIVPLEFDFFNSENPWGWVDCLLDSEKGSLPLARDLLKATLKELWALRDDRIQKRQRSDTLIYTINTYEEKQTIQFLASNNILPKYGFPVDIVNLDILSDSASAKNIEISRDLRMALSEFAPGSEIIANGKVWSPYALNKIPSRSWPVFQYAICKQCKHVYRYTSSLGVQREDKQRFCCDQELGYHYYLEPRFGFSTNRDNAKSPGESRKRRTYTTSVFFEKLADTAQEDKSTFEEDNEFSSVSAGPNTLFYQYSDRGQLIIFNQGNRHRGFQVCESCGYMQEANYSNKAKDKSHKTRSGQTCKNKYLHHVHFGYDFMTDVLELRLPLPGYEALYNEDSHLWSSILYAILEGASMSLGIDRSEINGCLYYNDPDNFMAPSLILYDDVPGGAGHVKRIAEEIPNVIFQASRKVQGQCGCGPETSCYGCIRNYSNQLIHEKLSRGAAFDYLTRLQSEKIYDRIDKKTAVIKAQSDVELKKSYKLDMDSEIEDRAKAERQTEIDFSVESDIFIEWSEAIDFASTISAAELAKQCARDGIKAPDVLGEEQYSDEQGIIGEIEFGWRKEKIALLTDLQAKSRKKLKELGWKVIMIDEAEKNEISETLRNDLHVSTL